MYRSHRAGYNPGRGDVRSVPDAAAGARHRDRDRRQPPVPAVCLRQTGGRRHYGCRKHSPIPTYI